ncbi:MAG: pyridoxal phosphate-dependent aminotransferase [Propionibacteriaceae bacterium]|nr:pyridoxal phosphate-dependent aminotransferase [Propionibacteriaceae bacterium]
MTISERAFVPATVNDFTAASEQLRAQQVGISELTDSNPTNHNLFDPEILDVVAAATRNAGSYQPHPRGSLLAREALAANFGGSPDDYWLTASTSESYNWLFTLLADPGGRVAVPNPGYPLINPLARLAGLEQVAYRTLYLHPHGWEYDLDSVANAATQTQAFVVVNPNNPTGSYTDTATAVALTEILTRSGTPLICDEVFFPFTLDSTLHPTRLAGNTAHVTFGLDGLSKLLAAPQLKLGWIRLSGPPNETAPYARALDAIADNYLTVGSPIAVALPALLEQAATSTARTCDRIRNNYLIVQQVFADNGYRVRHTAGGWMVLIDTPPIIDDDALALRILNTAHLAVHPGWFYDLDSPTTLALSLLPESPALRTNCLALKAAIAATITQ